MLSLLLVLSSPIFSTGAAPQKTPMLCPVDEKWAEFCLCYAGAEGSQQAFMTCKSCGWKNSSRLSQLPKFHYQPNMYLWTVKFDDVCFSYVPPSAFAEIQAEEIIFQNIFISNLTFDRGAFDGSQVRRLYFGSELGVEIAGLLPINPHIQQLTFNHINLGVIITGGFDGLHDCFIRLQGCSAREIQSYSFTNLLNCSLVVEGGPLRAVVDAYAFVNSRFHEFSYPSLERSLCIESWFRNVSVYQFKLNGYQGKMWPYCIDEVALIPGPNGEPSLFEMEYSKLAYIKRVDTTRHNYLFRQMSVLSPVEISFKHSLELQEIDGDTFEGVDVIAKLDLSETGLEFLPDFPQLSKITLLALVAPNRLACDCRSLWMYKWLMNPESSLLPRYQFCYEPHIDFITLLHHVCTLPLECAKVADWSSADQPAICDYFIQNDTSWSNHLEDIPLPTEGNSLDISVEEDEEVYRGSESESMQSSSSTSNLTLTTTGCLFVSLILVFLLVFLDHNPRDQG